jgi:hypothetical protein
VDIFFSKSASARQSEAVGATLFERLRLARLRIALAILSAISGLMELK